MQSNELYLAFKKKLLTSCAQFLQASKFLF